MAAVKEPLNPRETELKTGDEVEVKDTGEHI